MACRVSRASWNGVLRAVEGLGAALQEMRRSQKPSKQFWQQFEVPVGS